MRRSLLALATLALAVACDSPIDEANHASCTFSASFENDHARAAFLRANGRALVSRSFDGEAFFRSAEDDPTIMVVTADGCAVSGRLLAQLAQAPTWSSSPISQDSAQERIDRWLASTLESLSDQRVYGCVARFSTIGEEFTMWMARRLWYSGLRNANVEGANGDIFVVADEGCDTLRALTEAALADAERQTRDIETCSNASLRACGYPDGIRFTQ